LRERFSRFGNVLDVFMPREKESLKSRGFGFVTFSDRRDAEDAEYEMHEWVLYQASCLGLPVSDLCFWGREKGGVPLSTYTILFCFVPPAQSTLYTYRATHSSVGHRPS